MESNASIKLIGYRELLDELAKRQPNHLLLGNGFNNSLGIGTSYKNIFEQMRQDYLGYGEVEKFLQEKDYDIEALIGYLKSQVRDRDKDNSFLNQYIEKKVKLDFMKAANDIVQESIKNVYKEKNGGIHLLFKNFANYFTLNYDPCLYLLLLKFKKEDNHINTDDALAFQKTKHFIQEDLDNQRNKIYTKIKEAREKGKLRITIEDDTRSTDLGKITKIEFIASVVRYFKVKGWKRKDIESVCNRIWAEENNESGQLELSDGFWRKEFKVNYPQNLYFLHGAFHITLDKEKNIIKKITSKHNKAFCRKLEEAIYGEEKEVICVFVNGSKNKQQNIEQNIYLNKCFSDLAKINGALVILGSSLAKNDQHIFNQIVNSSVNDIYVSSCEDKKERDYKRATGIFKEKKVTLFNYKTISYSE